MTTWLSIRRTDATTVGLVGLALLVGCGDGGSSRRGNNGGSGGDTSEGGSGGSRTGGSGGMRAGGSGGSSTGTGGTGGTRTGGSGGSSSNGGSGGGAGGQGGARDAGQADAAADMAVAMDMAMEPDAATPDMIARPMVPMTAIPMPWKSEDIGMVGQTGATGQEKAQYFVKGSGADIWALTDQFHFLSRTVNGDAEIVTKLVGNERTDADAKAGIMFRDSNLPDARNAYMMAFALTPQMNETFTGKGSRLQYRDKRTAPFETSYADEDSLVMGKPDGAPIWLKLVRKGAVFTGFISGDGQNWKRDGEIMMTGLPNELLAGLAVTSHQNNDANTAVFESLRITALSDPAWTHTEVGTLGGYAAGSPAKLEVNTAGRGIANNTDGVTFVHKADMQNGDVEITGKITGLLRTGSDQTARVGFMLRQRLDPGARMVSFAYEVGPNGQKFMLQRRTADNGGLGNTTGMVMAGSDAGLPGISDAGAGSVDAIPGDAGTADAGVAPAPTIAPLDAPVWIKLVRVSNRFAGFVSGDGNTWQMVADVNVNVSSNGLLGVVVGSSNEAALAGATIENVQIKSPPTTMLPDLTDAAAPDAAPADAAPAVDAGAIDAAAGDASAG